MIIIILNVSYKKKKIGLKVVVQLWDIDKIFLSKDYLCLWCLGYCQIIKQ